MAETVALISLAHLRHPRLIALRIACYSKKGEHKMNPKEIAVQQIMFMGHVEDICGKQNLVPPVEVDVVDAGGNQYDFEYRPEDDGVDLPPLPIMLPLMLTFTDVQGTRLERRLLDIAPSPEWHTRFVQ
jgi:hypothetical protein